MKTLFITRCPPYPTSFGGGQRSNLIYQALSELGQVDMILVGRPSFITDEHMDYMRQHYNMIAHGISTQAREKGLWPMVEKVLGKRTTKRLAHNIDGSRSRLSKDKRLITKLEEAFCFGDYDLVFGRYANAFGCLGIPDGKIPAILDIDDLDTDVYESRIKLTKSRIQRAMLGWHKHNIEVGLRRVLADVDHAFVANPANRSFPGLDCASVLPNIPFSQGAEARPFVNSDPDSKTVMVIGSYDYEPNVEGVDWLVEEVWPIVHSQMPEAVLKIYGSNMADGLRQRWGSAPNVQPIGFAESLENAYGDAAISVCPVLRGAGSNIKIIESAAYSRVCLLTEVAARGYCQDEELAGLLPVAEAPAKMAKLVLYFLGDVDERDRVSKRLNGIVSSRYSRRGFFHVVHEAVKQSLAKGNG